MRLALAASLALAMSGCVELGPWDDVVPWCPTSGLRTWSADVDTWELEQVLAALEAHNWTEILHQNLGHNRTTKVDDAVHVTPLLTVTAHCFEGSPRSP